MSKLKILVEFFSFIKESKKWWLLPVVIILLLLGLDSPRKNSLNGAIPELMNIKLGSFFEIMGAEGFI